eukprot:SAG31_NODE_5455_length_2527_cov_1.923394_1_plen_696_part_00
MIRKSVASESLMAGALAQLLLFLLLVLVHPCVRSETPVIMVRSGQRGALERAVAAAAATGATLAAAKEIHLEPGHHGLLHPLILDSRHSGMRVVGHGGASISGGMMIGDWEVAGPAHCASCSEIWRARTPEGLLDSRQLYLPSTNERANRTWMPLPTDGPGEDAFGRVTVVGNPGQIASWRHNLTVIDLVYRGTPSAGVEWVEARCPCAGILRNTTSESLVIEVTDLCWKAAHSWRAPSGSHAGPVFVENVFELLGSEEYGHAGEFFLDASAGEVYYVPRPLELRAGRAAFVAVLPMVESLLQVKGARDLSFTGITFEHTTWLRPSTAVGFVETQAGDCLTCKGAIPSTYSFPTRCVNHSGTPAALTFVAVQNVTLFNSTFRHIGSNAVAFRGGSHGNKISHCEFTQLSASAVEIGTRGGSSDMSTDFSNNDVYFHSKSFLPGSAQDLDNEVADCVIFLVALEYRGAPALLVLYSRGTRILHNEIHSVPSTGISTGWGWGWYANTWQGPTTIEGNHVHHHLQLLGDGAAIYTLGPEGNLPFGSGPRYSDGPKYFANVSAILRPSVIRANWIHDAGDHQSALRDHAGLGEGSHAPGGIYTDEGSTNWNISGNVLNNVEYWLMACRPGSAPIGPVWPVRNWFGQTSNKTINNATRCPLHANVEVRTDAGRGWPADAQLVMQEAGPRLNGHAIQHVKL